VILTKFIKGICVDALIIAILTSIALSLVGVEFAVFLGVFAGLCNIIQYFGPFISMIPTFFVTLLTMDLTHAVVAVVAMIIIQQFDSNLIYPKVVGGSTGLHPLLVLLAVTVGGGIGGLVGMIIGVPVVSILKLLVDKFFAWKVAKKAAELEAAGELPEEFKDTVELQVSAQSIPPKEDDGITE
jgi:predicted PurR-regulated permease PerM